MLAQRYRTLYLLCRQFSSKDGGGGGAGGGSSPPNNGNKSEPFSLIFVQVSRLVVGEMPPF